MEKQEQWALGEKNQEIVNRAIACMREGRVEDLGKLMTEAQEVFDKYIAPMCPSQLDSPKLHATLADSKIKELTYGGKGVGSQGDGSIQFLAKDAECQKALVEYLNANDMPAYKLTIHPKHTVRKAIIPVAGFGTRLYPETRFLKKDFFPIVDNDNQVKPVILVLIEECISAGIEEICLVLGGKEERQIYKDFFEKRLPDEHLAKLPKEKTNYENHIIEIGKKLHYVYQIEKKGFGDAVYRCADFAGNEPVLLLLGDTLYKSHTNKCCALQFLEAYEKYNKPMVAINEVPLEKVSLYGIVSGQWADSREKVLNMSNITEKPTVAYAEEFLGVGSPKAPKKYYNVFGQYILTQEVFDQLRDNISNGVVNSHGEIELTTALEQVRVKSGMMGVKLDGEMFDMGVPDELRKTIFSFGR